MVRDTNGAPWSCPMDVYATEISLDHPDHVCVRPTLFCPEECWPQILDLIPQKEWDSWATIKYQIPRPGDEAIVDVYLLAIGPLRELGNRAARRRIINNHSLGDRMPSKTSLN